MSTKGLRHRPPRELCLGALFFLAACAGGPKPDARSTANLPPAPPAESLIGATSGALTALLGAPDLIRRDQGVEVWQYPGASCTLLIYLYTPEDGGPPRTAFVDARDRHAGAAPKQACLSQAIARRVASK